MGKSHRRKRGQEKGKLFGCDKGKSHGMEWGNQM